MNTKASRIFFAAAAIATGTLLSGAASAENIINAIYRVSLTDAATGTVYYTDRQSLRSWPTEDSCQREKNAFSGFHKIAVERFDIINAQGKRLTVKVDSSYCIVRK